MDGHTSKEPDNDIELGAFRKKARFARRLFKAVGQAAGKVVSQAGSTVGGVAGGVLRGAGRTVKGAGDRARLTFSGEVEETPDWDLRGVAESLTRWLVEEHAGKTDLQQQKSSTIELTELGQVSSFFEIVAEEPGIAGRRFRFLLRFRPLSDNSNFPTSPEKFTAEALLVMDWPQQLLSPPEGTSCLVWRQAAAVGPRNAAQDLAQRWLASELGGTFARKDVSPPKLAAPKVTPLLGREEEVKAALRVLLTPGSAGIVAITALGGTGKSYFLTHLRACTEGRVAWAAVDHQGLKGDDGVAVVARVLARLAQGLESCEVGMVRFGKELRLFQKARESTEPPSGLLGHFRKAAETAAGINPVIGAASAGIAFLTSWGQQMKEESEAVARDDALLALTRAFIQDLVEWSGKEQAVRVLWRRPVLVFDTYEWLAPLLDVWLRTQLLTADLLEKAGAAVVLAGRDHLFKVDTRWSEFASRLTSLELRPFSAVTARKLLRDLNAPEDRFDQLYELTQGSPLFLSLVAHIGEPDEATVILSERILEEIPREHWADFRHAALLDCFTPTALEKLFPDRDESRRSVLQGLLSAASFTVAGPSGRAFIPAVREVLRRSLRVELGEQAFARLEEAVGARPAREG